MKRIKTKLVAVILVVALALTGCASMNIEVVINSDGSGKVVMDMKIEKQAYLDYAKETYASMGIELTEQEIADLDKSMAENGYKVITVDGVEYYQAIETDNIKKGGLQEYFAGEAASYVTTDIVYLEFEATSDEELEQYAGAGVEMPEEGITYTLTVELPKNIVNTNGTIDKENPKRVTFEIDGTKGGTVFATSKSGVTIKTVKDTIKKSNTVKAPKITKLKANKVKKSAKKATITLKFKKVSGVKKYQVQYSTKKNFKGAKTKTIKKNTYTIKKLKKGKKYYVRVRATKKNYLGATVYSKWSKKSVKTKK